MITEPKPSGLLRLDVPVKSPIHSRLFSLARPALENVLGLPGLNGLYETALRESHGGHFAEKTLAALGVSVDDGGEALSRVPVSGPLVIVANHPFGAVEGLALAKLLLSVRSDVKFMANNLLGLVPEMRDLLILVDPFGGPGAHRSNLKPLKDCLTHLKAGGCLVVFPAGEVSHWRPGGEGFDPAWNDVAARLIRRSEAPALPVFFHGRNSALFHFSGLAHPLLRTALLGQELLRQKGKTLRVAFGGVLSFNRLKGFSKDADLTAYLRLRTYLLQNRSAGDESVRAGKNSFVDPLPPPQDAFLLQAEVLRMGAERVLVETETERIFEARSWEIPRLLLEIGRLREMSFREAGEGTGRARDLDEFDAHYRHLIVWNKSSREIIGAYRIGATDEILPRFGVKGFYTRTLFKFGKGLLDRIGPSLELGRSFVSPAHQKSFAPLLLLWKGILTYVARNPRYRMVFGPVSISDRYSEASRRLMMEYLLERSGRPDLARQVVPMHGFRGRPVAGWNDPAVRRLPVSLEELSDMVSDLETDRKGAPVLMRHYLKMGGKLLAFNVDPAFNNVLDGLILVDLPVAEEKSMRRYMGQEAWASYRRRHACES